MKSVYLQNVKDYKVINKFEYEKLEDLKEEFEKRNIQIGQWVELGDRVELGDNVKLGNRGVLKKDYSLKDLIRGSLGIVPDNKGNYLLYKRVNKIDKNKFSSIRDKNFIYEIGKSVKVKDYDENPDVSCGKGIHLSLTNYWKNGDSLIECKVNIKNIITCRAGKIRCKKCKVMREV